MASATSAVGMVKPANTSATPRFPRVARDQVDDGQQRGRAGLLRQRRGGDRDPREEAASASREQDRRRHRRQHEHLEVRGLTVLRHERDHGDDEQDPRDPSRARAVASPGFDREQQRGERHREHRDHAHRPQRGGLEERERRRVDVGHDRRLAVDGVLVELATVVEDVGLRGEERLVGVEHRREERGEAQHEREREQHQEDAHQLASLDAPLRARGNGRRHGRVGERGLRDGTSRGRGRRNPSTWRTSIVPGPVPRPGVRTPRGLPRQGDRVSPTAGRDHPDGRKP